MLTDLVPTFGALLGESAAPPRVGSVEAAARIGLMLRRLVGVITRGGRTLVLSLDDLQWADAASRTLLRDLPQWAGEAPVLLVGTFRDEELATNPSLATLVSDLRALRTPTIELRLEPLSVADSSAFLAKALDREPGDVTWLAERLAAQTGNNPFYLRQMVLHLRSEGLVRPAAHGWEWDRDAILAAGVGGDAVHFLASKIESQGAVARSVLEVASCIGDVFEIEQIRELGAFDRMAIHGALTDLAAAGFLAPCRDGFRFVHGRVREAAASLLAPAERARLHARIVRPVLDRDDGDELGARAFELAEHIRLAQPVLDPSERIPAARCYLRAALRALAAGGADSAAAYLDTALEWMRDEDWESAPELMFDLYLHRAEVYALGDGALETERLCGLLMEREHELLPRARLDALWIYAGYLASGSAVERAIEAYGRLGLRIPRAPSRFATRRAMRRLRKTTDRKPDTLYLRPPDRTDARGIALLVLYRRAAITLFRSYRPGMLYVVNEVLRHIQVSGSPRPPAYLLASAALLESTVGGDTKRLRGLCEQVARLKQARPDPESDHRCDIVLHAICMPWYRPFRLALDPLKRAIEHAAEVGDSTYQHAARLNDVTFRFVSGAPLAEVQARADAHLAAIPGIEVHATLMLRAYARATRLLRGVPPERTHSGINAARPSLLPQNAAPLRVTQMFVSLLLGPQLDDPDDDGEGFAHLRLRHAFGNSPPIVLGFALLQGIDAANRIRPGARARVYERLLLDRARRLRGWAADAPENFAPAADLLAAEIAALGRSRERAFELFTRASDGALAHGATHFAAIANERLARMLAKAGDRRASQALERAIEHYDAWGATAKVAQMCAT